MSENLETMLDSSSESECVETILDNETEKCDLNGGFGELTAQLNSMFQNPKMQNALSGALSGAFGSLTAQLKPQSGNTLPKDFTTYNVSYEDMMTDINMRVVPHLLSKLSGDGLSGIQSVNVDKTSKMYGTMSMLYSCANYLIQNGNDKDQIELYRDRIVGQMVWVSLYDANNFYDAPTNETNTLIADTMKEFATGVLNSQLSTLKLNELFKNLNTQLE